MTLYVGNIDFKITSKDLADIFCEFGIVVSSNVIIDRETQRSKGFAFVEMETDKAGRDAINALHDALVEGRAIKVNEAKPKGESSNNNSGFQKKW